ncbi:MAG: 50S ribosomal protein L4 [Candidatus Daviesbacteria bacterium]|nr:50S ribosomal protein L4 [Candidatus Daviesbacteria bacterium]
MPKVVKEKKVTKSEKVEIEKEATKKVVVKKDDVKSEAVNLSVPMFGLDGGKDGTLSLPEEIFGVEVNKKLLSQALRVYINNNTGHFSNTKTRGEVKGSTRKVRAQKGTGGARHGSVRAPIFIGGGIALGPKFRKIELELPKKMKRAALISALAAKNLDQEVMGISGLDKVTGKTKEMKAFFDKVALKNVLIVISEKNEKLQRAVKNLEKVSSTLADQVDILELTKFKNIMFTKTAIEKLQLRINKKEVESAK